MANFIILVILALIIWGLYRFFFVHKLPKVDFSFGRNDFKNLIKWVKSGNHTQVDQTINAFNSDDLTQALDCLALGLTEKGIKKYQDIAVNKALSSLILGVFYGHEAWKIRGRGQGITISEDTANQFMEMLNLSATSLEDLAQHSKYGAEVNARMIRVSMGLGDGLEVADSYFRKAIQLDKNHLWAYIHFSEVVQPKWYGTKEQVVDFYKNLPDNKLIQTIVRLKLSYDSISSDQNLLTLSGSMEDLEKDVRAFISELDASNVLFKETSIHKYIIYGYMFVLASHFNHTPMSEKYWKLLENRLPLYPFGLT